MDDEIDPELLLEDNPFAEVPDLCLCGRDPASAEVQLDLAKALILRLRYGIFMDGCLSEIADVFDALVGDLRPMVARELKQLVREVSSGLNAFAADLLTPDGRKTWTQ